MIASTLLLRLLEIKKGVGVVTYAATAPEDLRDEVSFALLSSTYNHKRITSLWLNSLS